MLGARMKMRVETCAYTNYIHCWFKNYAEPYAIGIADQKSDLNTAKRLLLKLINQ